MKDQDIIDRILTEFGIATNETSRSRLRPLLEKVRMEERETERSRFTEELSNLREMVDGTDRMLEEYIEHMDEKIEDLYALAEEFETR